MAKVRRAFDVTTPAQEAALASLGDPDEIARRRALNADGRAELGAIARARTASTPAPARSATSSTSTWARTPAPLFERLLREGVIVRPLHGFGAPTAIRVTVGTPEEHEFLASALGRAGRRAATRSGAVPWLVPAVLLPCRSISVASWPSREQSLPAAVPRDVRLGLGNWLAVIALTVDVYDRTHSGWWVGALLIANILPAVFIGLLLGPARRPALAQGG